MSIRDELISIVTTADYEIDERPFPDRIVDAILARYSVVELPEASDDGMGGIQWDVDSRDDLARVRINHKGQIVSDSISNPSRDAASARSQAAALLAAANHTEGKNA